MATYYYDEENESSRGSFWGKFWAVLLGFLFGLICTIGSIAAVVYTVFFKNSVKENVSAAEKLVDLGGFDYTQFITDEYAEKSVAAIVKDLVDLAGGFAGGKGNLATLNKVSPQVEKQITKLAGTLNDTLNIPLAVTSANMDAAGNILDENNNVIIDKDGNVVKKDANGMAILTDEAGNMLVGLMDVPFSVLPSFLTQSVEPVELGSVLSSKSLGLLRPGTENYDLLMLVCYGDTTDYETTENGEIARDEHGRAVMKNGVKATTIGDFLSGGSAGEGGGVTSVLDKLTVSGIMDAFGDGSFESEPLVRTLLYGTEGETYIYDEETQKVVWLPLAYTLDESENQFTSPSGTKYTYASESKRWVASDGSYIAAVPAAGAVSYSFRATAAEADDKPDYRYRVYDRDGNLLYQLADASEGTNRFEAYGEDDVIRTHRAPSLMELMNTFTSGDLLDGIYLYTVLGLNSPLDEGADPLMVSLAYGNEGEHYIVKDGEVVWLTNPETGEKYAPRSIADLKNGSDVLNSIRLSTILNISPLDEDADELMVSLAYGNEGEHYTIKDGEIVWLENPETGEKYAPRSVADLKNGSDILNGIYLYTVLNVSPLDEDADELMVSLAYGNEGEHYIIKDGEIVWLENPETGEKYAPRSIADLQNGSDILNGIYLYTVLNISPLDEDADELMVSLAYGNEGEHYIIKDGEIVWLTNPETGEKYAPRSIADLQNGSDILNGIYLYTVLDVSPLDEEADRLIVALAYGNEGEHYTVKDGEIVWLTNPETGEKYAPRSIADLQNGSDILNGIYLYTVLDVSPLDEDADELMVALAYGNEGEHYTVKDGKIVWLTNPETGEKYSPRTIADFQNGSELLDSVRLYTVLDVSPLDEEADPLMVALAYGNEGEHYIIKDGEIVWLTNPETGEKYAPRSISDLKDGSEVINDVHISVILDVTANSDGIMRALAFGNEGEDYEIADGEIVFIGDASPRTIGDLKEGNLINDIRLSAVLSSADPDDKITMYVLYGVEGTDYVYDEETEKIVMLNGASPRTIGDLSGENNPIANITKDLTVGDLIGDSGDSKLLAAIAGWKIDELSDQSRIMSLKISDVIDVTDDSPSVLKAMADWELNDLNRQEKIDSLKLSDLLDEKDLDENVLLRHLKNSTVATLSEDVERLQISMVFAAEVYRTEEDEKGVLWFVDESGERLYKTSEETDDEALKARRVLTGTWKYLLTDQETGREGDYTVTEIDLLVTNMTVNIQAASVRSLYEDGVIQSDDPTFLENTIRYEFHYEYTNPLTGKEESQKIGEVATRYYFDEEETQLKTHVGDLTITELLNYVSEVIRLFD